MFEHLIFFDESEYCDSYVDDETLRIVARLDPHLKDLLLFPKELDDTG